MVNRLKTQVLQSLFPNYCCFCGVRRDLAQPICAGCLGDLPANTRPCRQCALPLPALARTSEPALCGACITSPPAWDRVVAPWLYSEQMAALIHRWKYRGERWLTPLLASLWLEGAPELTPIDQLVPVPLHWRRHWRRGYNQSELLAQHLLAGTSCPVEIGLARQAARRNRPTRPQSGMNASRRRRNMAGAFTSTRPCDNLRLAIVDDVLTTGATAAALALALREAGARHIEIWCLARTPEPTT